MFRQTVIISCLIALVAASDSDTEWFEIGTRVDGDQNIRNQTARSYPSDSPRVHTVYTAFNGGDISSYFTYSRFDVDGGFDDFTVHGLDNGFKIAVTKYNTTQLTVRATIYGFATMESAPKILTPKVLNIH